MTPHTPYDAEGGLTDATAKAIAERIGREVRTTIPVENVWDVYFREYRWVNEDSGRGRMIERELCREGCRF
jgi:hypothetical protein